MNEHGAGTGEWRRGWPVVAAAMIGIGAGPGLFQNLSSLFTPGMAAEFGWSRGQIATAAGLGLVGGLAAPFLGRFADRVGARVVIAAAMLLLGAAYGGLAMMAGRLWQYQALILCLALAVPGTSALVYGKLVAARFTRHRGLALALATSGLSLTTLALPPVVALVIARFGWRGGFVALGVFVIGIALPLVLLALRRAPAVLVDANADPADHLTGMTGAEARRTPRFWALGATALLINFATVGLVTQMVPFGLDRGLTATQAALAAGELWRVAGGRPVRHRRAGRSLSRGVDGGGWCGDFGDGVRGAPRRYARVRAVDGVGLRRRADARRGERRAAVSRQPAVRIEGLWRDLRFPAGHGLARHGGRDRRLGTHS